MKISHIGYAVKDIDISVDEFKKLGFKKIKEKVVDKKRNVIIQFMDNKGCCIELIAPLDEESPVKNILKKLGDMPYHICYETNNIVEKIDELKRDKYFLIEHPSNAIGMEGNQVAFLYKKNVGIIELVQISKSLKD
ncbi:VOC family protein [Clostridium sporogenes]|uniref:VOC family protein n=1 Tax=Clostridium sporogenes TaxID=1509 RepID=UPI002238E3E5|nr:VOC family protein [Clostridium sporogenes]MCW6077019.1 VOC family protein [Clostridium sporogenes]